MRKPQKLKPKRGDDDVIADDGELIAALGMSEAEAALHIGKTRQSLNAKLGASQTPSRDYLRTSEILTLINAARHVGRNFDARAVRAYVQETRGGPAASQTVMDMLDDLLLGKGKAIDVAGASSIVFILPGFGDLATHQEGALKELKRISAEIRAADPMPKVFVLSSTELQARMAAQSLGLVQGENFFGREIVDHYFPMIMVYHGAKEQRGFVLTESDMFAEAPYYRLEMATACVLSLLPEAVTDAVRAMPEPERDPSTPQTPWPEAPRSRPDAARSLARP